MATNALGAVKLPAYITDVKKREAALPPPPTPPPVAPPPPGPEPPLGKVGKFLQATPSEQMEMMPPKVQAAGRGVVRGIEDVGSSLAEPRNLAMLAATTAATAFAPPVVLGLMAAGFTIEGIHQLANKVPAAVQAFKMGNTEEGTRLLTTAVPDLAMALPGIHAAPSTIGTIGRGIGEALPRGGMLEPSMSEAGFTTIDFLTGGKLVGRQDRVGPEIIGGGMTPGMAPQTARMTINSLPKTTNELPTALAAIEQQGIDPRTATFKVADETMNIEGLAARFPEVAEWLKLYVPAPPAGPTAAAPPITPVTRTPSGRRTTITDPMKLQRQQQLQQQAIEQKLDVNEALQAQKPAPSARVTTKGNVKQPSFPMEPVPEAPPAAAAPPTEIPGSALERAIAALLEHNRLLSRRLDLMEQGMSPRAAEATAAAEAPAPTPKAAPKAPAAKAAAPAAPEIPTTPGVTTPPGDLAAQIQQSITEAPKVQLTQAELKGMGAPTGKGKKGPVSYVGKTMEEKYVPKEAAAQPEAIKAAQTPRNQAELRDAIDAFNRGEGRPVNIVRRGLGGAKSTRGVILDNIKDVKGKPTNFYSYMPENSTSVYPIQIKDMEPIAEGASYTMPVPRHAQRTYDVGSQIAVPRKAVKTEQFILPGGGTGYKLKDITLPPEQVGAMIDRFEASGTPEALEKSAELKKHLEPDGSIIMQQVLHGKEAPTVQARHTVRTITKPEAPSGRLGSVLDTPARRVAQDVEQSNEYLAREKELGADPESVAIEKRKLGIHDVPGRAKLYFKGELEPVARTLEPTTTQPSREIKPQTAAAEKEVRERMTAAGGERAQPAKPIQEEGAGISGEAIAKATGRVRPEDPYKGKSVSQLKSTLQSFQSQIKDLRTEAASKMRSMPAEAKAAKTKAEGLTQELPKIQEAIKAAQASGAVKPTPPPKAETGTYEGARAREMALEQEQRQRMEHKPGVFEAVKPTPPPAAIPAKAVEAPSLSAERIRNQQLLPNLEKRLSKVKGTPAGDKLEQRIKNIKESLKPGAAPKTSAKLSEPAPTKPYTQPATATKIPPPPSPTKVKATSTGGSTDSWTLTHPKGGSMEVRFTDDGVYVEQVRTPPEAQRQGVASEMYEQLGRMMKQRGIPGKNIEGNIQGPPDVVRKLRAKAAKIAGAGKPSSSRYDID